MSGSGAESYTPPATDFRKDNSQKREYQHHRKRFPWPEHLHLKFITAIFDIGLAVANSYALDETVDNISSNPSYNCDSRAVRQFIQEINEYRQLSRLRDEKWIQLIPQRLLNDTTSELGKRLIIETQRREAEMRYLATRGPLSSKRISLCSDVIFLNPSASGGRQLSLTAPSENLVQQIIAPSTARPATLQIENNISSYAGEDESRKSLMISEAHSPSSVIAESSMEIERSPRQYSNMDFPQSEAALQLADFNWEGDMDLDTIRSFLGHFGLLKEDETTEDELSFLDL